MLKKPFFSIVIPTLNEEKCLPLLLSDLAKQTYENFEVIHVDGNSEDKTIEESKKWKKRIYLKIEKTKIRNVSHQRNLGGKKTRGEWIIFMDADNRLPKYFLQGIKYRLDRKSETDIFTTWLKIEKQTPKYQSMERAINLGQEIMKNLGKEVALGAMIGVKKSIFEKIKFDETQKVVEDSLFVKEVTNAGFIYSLFRDPKYFYSMRRVESEGTLKQAFTSSRLLIQFLQGKNFSEKDFGYFMEGGQYYNQQSTSAFKNILTTIEKTSEKQLQRVKKIVNDIKEF
jgi:glycosyltransferase involved in cell wall biosynthesis